jgi:very-short-patch-repair endonuclease
MQYTTYPNNEPSHSERLIMKHLESERIKFEREVNFTGLVNPLTNAPLRYDFYIPQFNLIIEYDGVKYHASIDVKDRDRIKDNFAKRNKIDIVRISGIRNISAFFASSRWKNKVSSTRVIKKKKPKRKYIPKPQPAHLQGEFKKIDYIPPAKPKETKTKPKKEFKLYAEKPSVCISKAHKEAVKENPLLKLFKEKKAWQ